MDGPNVNLKFLDQLINQSEIQSEKSQLDMGSCRLHVVHGAFQNGHKNAKWNVNTFTNCSMTAQPGDQTTKK